MSGLHGGYAWLGIPYGLPPEGALRWRAPRAFPAWSGTRDALSFGSSCPQFASPLGGDDSAPDGTLVGSEFGVGDSVDLAIPNGGEGLDVIDYSDSRRHRRGRAVLELLLQLPNLLDCVLHCYEEECSGQPG